MEITIGADPELFLKKDGKFFSAYGIIPGTKEAPHPVPRGAVQVDGMALEFNIDPAKTFEEFNISIDTVLGHLRSMVPAEYEFDFSASAQFDKKHIEEQLPEALVIGCDPDWDAYTHRQRPPMTFGNTDRAAGGHIHVGWGSGFDTTSSVHINSCAILTRLMDSLIGIPSVLFDPDNARRKTYGRAGSFRPKPYGMEYRTLSNFWLKKPEYRKFVFDQTQQAMKIIMDRKEMLYTHYAVPSTINASNRQGAASFVRKYHSIFKGIPAYEA